MVTNSGVVVIRLKEGATSFDGSRWGCDRVIVKKIAGLFVVASV
jgi:hypothetical protein